MTSFWHRKSEPMWSSHMYTATYLTICYGWRVGIVHSIFIITATAAPTSDLTLNLVFIFLKYIILPYMKPTPAANQSLKHTNPQFYIGNTDLTRRILCDAGALLGTKIHPVGPFLGQNNWQNLLLQQHSGQKAVLRCSNALHCDFIAHIVLKQWNH